LEINDYLERLWKDIQPNITYDKEQLEEFIKTRLSGSIDSFKTFLTSFGIQEQPGLRQIIKNYLTERRLYIFSEQLDELFPDDDKALQYFNDALDLDYESFIFDIDGTLTNDELLPEESVDALISLMQENKTVVLCSGRVLEDSDTNLGMISIVEQIRDGLPKNQPELLTNFLVSFENGLGILTAESCLIEDKEERESQIHWLVDDYQSLLLEEKIDTLTTECPAFFERFSYKGRSVAYILSPKTSPNFLQELQSSAQEIQQKTFAEKLNKENFWQSLRDNLAEHLGGSYVVKLKEEYDGISPYNSFYIHRKKHSSQIKKSNVIQYLRKTLSKTGYIITFGNAANDLSMLLSDDPYVRGCSVEIDLKKFEIYNNQRSFVLPDLFSGGDRVPGDRVPGDRVPGDSLTLAVLDKLNVKNSETSSRRSSTSEDSFCLTDDEEDNYEEVSFEPEEVSLKVVSFEPEEVSFEPEEVSFEEVSFKPEVVSFEPEVVSFEPKKTKKTKTQKLKEIRKARNKRKNTLKKLIKKQQAQQQELYAQTFLKTFYQRLATEPLEDISKYICEPFMPYDTGKKCFTNLELKVKHQMHAA
jgi:hydroxymethylpyrimidine pyrophosphatase-like HAD family hydrolase